MLGSVYIVGEGSKFAYEDLSVENVGVKLSDAGKIVMDTWLDLPNHNSGIELGPFIVMPDHVHGIVMLVERAGLEPRFACFNPGAVFELVRSAAMYMQFPVFYGYAASHFPDRFYCARRVVARFVIIQDAFSGGQGRSQYRPLGDAFGAGYGNGSNMKALRRFIYIGCGRKKIFHFLFGILSGSRGIGNACGYIRIGGTFL